MGKKTLQVNWVKKFTKKLSKDHNIDKVILFGSFARGDNKKWSDVDMLIVSEDFKNIKKVKRAVNLYNYWTHKYPVDFLCYTPEEFNKLKKQVTIVREAVREGIEIK